MEEKKNYDENVADVIFEEKSMHRRLGRKKKRRR